MNPLTVTWAPLKYTEIGWENFHSHINSGLTNLLCTPNGKFQKKLARLCFEELGDAFHVFVLGQNRSKPLDSDSLRTSRQLTSDLATAG